MMPGWWNGSTQDDMTRVANHAPRAATDSFRLRYGIARAERAATAFDFKLTVACRGCGVYLSHSLIAARRSTSFSPAPIDPLHVMARVFLMFAQVENLTVCVVPEECGS